MEGGRKSLPFPFRRGLEEETVVDVDDAGNRIGHRFGELLPTPG